MKKNKKKKMTKAQIISYIYSNEYFNDMLEEMKNEKTRNIQS